MTTICQRNFSGGEIAPGLYARVDQQKYTTSVRQMRNFFPRASGGAVNRAGSVRVASIKDPTVSPNMLPFVFNVDDSYVLEFGDNYVRFVRNGARLQVLFRNGDLWSALTTYAIGDVAISAGVTYRCIVAHTNQLPAYPSTYWYRLDWSAGITYVIGDLTVVGGVMYYCILGHTNHTPVNATYWYALEGVLTVAGNEAVYELPTLYDISDVPYLQIVQTNDVLTITHETYPTKKLSRYGVLTWKFEAVSFVTGTGTPIISSVTAGRPAVSPGSPTLAAVGGNGGLPKDRYVIETTFRIEGGFFALLEDAIVHPSALSTVGGADAGNPVALTWTAPAGNPTVYKVYKLVGSVYKLIATQTALTFTDDASVTPTTILAENNNNVVEYDYVVTAISSTSGIEGNASAVSGATGFFIDNAHPNIITWPAVTGATEYNVYRTVTGVSGFVGSVKAAGAGTFYDTGFAPDFAVRPPVSISLTDLSFSGQYAACIAYYQQRLVLGHTYQNPNRVFACRIGNPYDISRHSPGSDDDGFTFDIAGARVNSVRYLLTLNAFFIFTSDGTWAVNGDANGTLTPTAINLRQKGYRGAALGLPPIPIDTSALFVTARGCSVRDLQFDFTTDGYTGRNLSIFAPHLFRGHTILSWAYQQEPESIVWAVRDDGVLLGLTYIREHEVWGWHRHDTGDGDQFERVCVVPEGNEDVLYVLVKRTVNGAVVRYIERMHSRDVEDVTIDAHFVDCGTIYDGRQPNAGYLILTEAAGVFTLTASVATFMLGDELAPTEYVLRRGDDEIRCLVITYTSTTVVIVTLSVPAIPASMAASAHVTSWGRAKSIIPIFGLTGRTVSACVDGAAVTGLIVAADQVTLSTPGEVVHVGLPIVADLETLDIDDPARPMLDRKKRVNSLTLEVEASRGFFAGQDEDHLDEQSQNLDGEEYDPTTLQTGTFGIGFDATWDNGGRVFVRQVNPLPLTVLAVAPSGAVGS